MSDADPVLSELGGRSASELLAALCSLRRLVPLTCCALMQPYCILMSFIDVCEEGGGVEGA